MQERTITSYRDFFKQASESWIYYDLMVVQRKIYDAVYHYEDCPFVGPHRPITII